jgi:hypothetical protein
MDPHLFWPLDPDPADQIYPKCSNFYYPATSSDQKIKPNVCKEVVLGTKKIKIKAKK